MSEISLQELCAFLNQFLEVEAYKDYCPNGLQVEGKSRIEKIAVAVSASLATLEKAVEMEVDALLVHHGIFWNGDAYPIVGVKKQKIEKLIKNEISLLAYHLPLDGHQQVGNNWKAALDMGWTDLMPCCLANGVPIGVMGKFQSLGRLDFQKGVEKYYQHRAETALGGKEEVCSGMIVSGGAYKMLSEAMKHNVDCFITGNYDEPVWHDAFELGINFFACGHSATERVGPQAIGKYLQETLQLDVSFIDIHNPF